MHLGDLTEAQILADVRKIKSTSLNVFSPILSQQLQATKFVERALQKTQSMLRDWGRSQEEKYLDAQVVREKYNDMTLKEIKALEKALRIVVQKKSFAFLERFPLNNHAAHLRTQIDALELTIREAVKYRRLREDKEEKAQRAEIGGFSHLDLDHPAVEKTPLPIFNQELKENMDELRNTLKDLARVFERIELINKMNEIGVKPAMKKAMGDSAGLLDPPKLIASGSEYEVSNPHLW